MPCNCKLFVLRIATWSYNCFLRIIIIFTHREFFTSAFADGLSLESEWQVSSSIQDSSQYSGRSQQCCSLDGLHSSSYLQVFQFLYQSFGDCNKSTNYNWHNRHFLVSQFFSIPKQSSRYLSFFLLSFNFTLKSAGTSKSTIPQIFFLFFFSCCW